MCKKFTFQITTILVFGTFLFACTNNLKQVMDETSLFKVTRTGDHVQISVPSASGITKYKDAIYAIGDDSPYLFRMDTDGNVLERILLLDEYVDADDDIIIEKSLKPDFESIELVNKEMLYILGSGSKSPLRDLLIIYDFKNAEIITRVSLSNFYQNIKDCSFMNGFELNIEGTAVVGDNFYFFNRSNNCFFDFPIADFDAICKGEIPFYEPRVQYLKLPKLKGIQAGVSGATGGLKMDKLVFTASVENTGNAYDDGEILGSFVGLLTLDKSGKLVDMQISTIENLVTKKKVKVESVCVNKKIDDSNLEVILVTDNDGKASTFFKCLIQLPN